MFDKEKIDLIIKNNWNSESQNSIAWGLNAQNFTTQKGKKWTQASVSYYALNVLKLERKHKEFTKNIVTQEVKTQNLTEVKELDKTSLIETAVFEKQGKFFTDSLSIAKIFDKRHDHVLEAIKNCKVSENFWETSTLIFKVKNNLKLILQKKVLVLWFLVSLVKKLMNLKKNLLIDLKS